MQNALPIVTDVCVCVCIYIYIYIKKNFFKYDHKYSKYIIIYWITNMVNGNIVKYYYNLKLCFFNLKLDF